MTVTLALPAIQREARLMQNTNAPAYFSEWDRIALRELVGLIARPGMRVAEIGSWAGNGSTRVLIDALRQIDGARLFCIDNWRGNPGWAPHQDYLRDGDMLATFRANVTAAGGATFVEAITAGSTEAAGRFDDASLDLIFIDADHRYSAVRADIAAWLPKVRPGGIVCGHDCERRPGWLSWPRLWLSREVEMIPWDSKRTPTVHPGVVLAVQRAFGGSAHLFADKRVKLPDGRSGCSTIWWRQC
jgi:hypothetical protein